MTLLSTNEIFGDLEAQLHFFDVVDDVFVPEFGFVLVEKPGGNESDISTLKLANRGVRELYHLNDIHALDEIKDLPSGPYFLHGPNLHQAWKLYDDTAEAFTFGVIPEDVHKPDQYVALMLTCLHAHLFQIQSPQFFVNRRNCQGRSCTLSPVPLAPTPRAATLWSPHIHQRVPFPQRPVHDSIKPGLV